MGQVGRRTKSRRAALELMFEAESREVPLGELLAERQADQEAVKQVPQYAAEIVAGVTEHIDRIDEILTTYSTGWPIDRMPRVDRQALRLAVWEILYNEEVPDAVAIDEAVNLVSEYSTDKSPNFVSGLLNRIKDLKPSLID